MVFKSKEECENFLSSLNSLYSSNVRCLKKNLLFSRFLMCLDEKHSTEFITSVYRKSNFTGQYLHWDSFSHMKCKINLVATLIHKILFICSRSRLQAELDKIQSILVANGYPNRTTTSTFTKKIQQFNQLSQHRPKKCLVYLHLPWVKKVY